MNHLVETFQINKLDELIGMEKYILQIDKWYSTLEKIFILSLEGNTGIGKSLLATLFLENKNYNILYFDISSIKSKNLIYDKIKESLCDQIVSSVKFSDCILNSIDNGVDTFIECGPNKILSGLVRRTDKTIKVISISEYSDLEVII